MLKSFPYFLAVIFLVSLSCGVPTLASSDDLAPVRYVVSFADAKNHYADVEVTLPTEGAKSIEVFMAVWTPGSYLVREYARHVQDLEVENQRGEQLAVTKTTKNRWRIECGNNNPVRLKYRLYCREMSVRTNWVEQDLAFLNGAPTFITLPNYNRPHEVELRLPEGWGSVATGLTPLSGGAPHRFVARDFDELVDCPIVLGNPSVQEFRAGGKLHRIVHGGDASLWDTEQVAEDIKKIVDEQCRFWGVVPYEHYHFLNMIVESGGGLEHSNSTLMLTSRWSYRDQDRYRRWLGLVSHEFFHTWNVKRLRPASLGPFDYERENYTESLWIVEGVTSYYDDLLLKRAGLLTEKQYLERLSSSISGVQRTPGRLIHPLAMTSHDAWIKYYRRDENSPNSTISYYTKGALVAFLLDMHVRNLTKGEHSLDDVMRTAYARYSGSRGFTPAEFRAVTSEVAGAPCDEWFRVHVDEATELDYQDALAWLGLRFKNPLAKKKPEAAEENSKDGAESASSESEPEAPKRNAWLGLRTEDRKGRMVITQVRLGTPAAKAGLNVDDEILALDEYRVQHSSWSSRKKQYQPDDAAKLLVARRGQLLEIPVTFAAEPLKLWQIEANPDADEAALNRRKEWLGD